MALLEVSGLCKSFGGVTALKSVDLKVGDREIVGLIGPNGAGKTSFFNCITGLTRADSGQVLFNAGARAVALSGLACHRVLEAGVARTFQNVRIFRNMTALENVSIGFYCRTRAGLREALFTTRRAKAEDREVFGRCVELLHFMGLRSVGDEIAGNLPYGSQKRLEIARALASSPKLLLLDEPVAGMNPSEKDQIRGIIGRIREGGTAVLVIEHDMRFVMPLSDRVVVMDEGAKIADGAPQQVQNDARVIAAYLGEN